MLNYSDMYVCNASYILIIIYQDMHVCTGGSATSVIST